MKTKNLILITISFFVLFSCSNNDEPTTAKTNSDDMITATNIDEVSDDVLNIVESQSNETVNTGRKVENTDGFFPKCMTITTVKNGNTWVRTVDFSETNCTLSNGNTVRGKVIISFTNNFQNKTRTLNYSFDNFYHNDRLVEGNRNVVKTILDNGHPQATIALNMKITNPDGGILTCEGNRIREFVEGYETIYNFTDNVFSITGNWTTTLPNGNIHSVLIAKPLIVKMSCPRIVTGTISITRNNDVAFLDYGDGECDAKATITLNGEVIDIILGKK